jgi:hypothetical protein
VKLEFELGDNRKVTAAASNCPKQVGVFVFAGSDPLKCFAPARMRSFDWLMGICGAGLY